MLLTRGLTAKRARRNFAVRGCTVGVAGITQIPHAVRAVMDVLRMTLPAASGLGLVQHRPGAKSLPRSASPPVSDAAPRDRIARPGHDGQAELQAGAPL